MECEKSKRQQLKTFAGTFIGLLGAIGASVSSVNAAPIFFSGTGHYYDFVGGSFTWEAARLDAMSRTFLGTAGYLATLTSPDEDQFIRANFSSQVTPFVGGWFGADWDGSGGGATTGWSWVTGEPFVYTGWNSGEPNHLSGEDAAHFSFGGWNDIERSRTDAIGYFIEFEPRSSPVPAPGTALLVSLGVAAWLLGRRCSHKSK